LVTDQRFGSDSDFVGQLRDSVDLVKLLFHGLGCHVKGFFRNRQRSGNSGRGYGRGDQGRVHVFDCRRELADDGDRCKLFVSQLLHAAVVRVLRNRALAQEVAGLVDFGAKPFGRCARRVEHPLAFGQLLFRGHHAAGESARVGADLEIEVSDGGHGWGAMQMGEGGRSIMVGRGPPYKNGDRLVPA